jgi:TolB-like protein/DNA-binding SARP family transcriptional activator/Flp pilus assembly protein TadD
MGRPDSASITLLGRCSLSTGDTPPQTVRLSSRKAWALIAYLAMQPDRTATRGQLAALLWGDHADAQARHSLRQCLVSLRQDLAALPNLVAIDSDRISLSPSVTVDALEVLSLANSPSPTDVQCAASLYSGPFLADLEVGNEALDEWVQTQRGRLETAAATLFERATAEAEKLGRGADALAAAEGLLALDPLREDWQRTALRICARYRGRDAALAQAKKFTVRLEDELGTEPEPATLALIEEIRRAEFAPIDVARERREAEGRLAVAAPSSDSERKTVGRRWPRYAGLAATAFGLIAVGALFTIVFRIEPAQVVQQAQPPAAAAQDDGAWQAPRLSAPTAVDMPALQAKAIIPLVVLPFTAMAGLDSADQAAADEISDDLINRLSRFREMRVISRQTAWLYRGRPVDVAGAGAELGVRYAVEGTVRGNGTKFLVNVQLVDTPSRLQVWGDHFEWESAAIANLQDEIARGLARNLQIQITQAESRRPVEPAVAALIAKGQAARYRGRTLENLTEALALYEEALARDPELVPGMVGLAATSLELVTSGLVTDPPQHMQRAEALLKRALQKDPDHSGAYYQLGLLAQTREKYESALQSYARSIELNPSMPFAYANLGISLTRIGRAGEAMPHLRYAMRLSPKDPSLGFWYLFAGETELELGNNEAALEWLQRALMRMPKDNPLAHGWLASAYALGGDHANSAKHFAEFRQIMPAARFDRMQRSVKQNLERDEVYRRRLLEGLALAFAASH